MAKNHKLGTVLISYNLNYDNLFPKAVCAHTEDAQSDLNQFLLTFSRQHGRRVTIADTTKYSLSAAIKPIMSGSSRASRNFRRWSCICCTCKWIVFLLTYT